MFNKSEYDSFRHQQISGEPQSEWEPDSIREAEERNREPESPETPLWNMPEGGVLPESPDTPVWGPPEGGMLPESPDTPVWGPPEGGMLPESPDTPVWGPPEGGMLPESPDTPVWGPPAGAGEPSVPVMPDDTHWGPPVQTPGVQVSPSTPGMSTERFCTLRFLHAAVDQPAVDISVNQTDPVSMLGYGELTGYFAVRAGRVVVTIRQAGTGHVLNQTRFMLENGGIYTIAVVNAAAGIALYLMKDVSCRKSVYNSCVRAVNLTNQAPALDILLGGGRTLFTNVRFLDVTGYRQISAGVYDFSAAESGSCNPDIAPQPRQAVQIIPVVLGKNCQPSILATAQRVVEQDRVYTLYIIGNAYAPPYLNMILAESYFEY